MSELTPEELVNAIYNQLFNNRRIQAMVLIKNNTGASLKEAAELTRNYMGGPEGAARFLADFG